MQARSEAARSGSPARRAPSAMAVALQVAADAGYGLWALLGTGLALGIYRSGRGGSLVPLMIGLVLVSAGLVVAALRRPGWPDWYGWYPGRSKRPTREALTALATYLPVLAVAGLTRGDNDFWATRLAGAVLMMACLGHLLGSTRRLPGRPTGPAHAATLPVGRVMGALFGGGLWLWLCVAADRRVANGPALPAHPPWLLLLLVTVLLLGLIEGMRWHALRAGGESGGRGAARLPQGRFYAALLGHAMPCLALLLADRWQGGGLLAATAAVSHLAGRAWEQWLYRRACARNQDGCAG